MTTETKAPLYIGTKTVHASPMTRLAYNEYRGWPLPADENGDDAGFLVEYVDGGKSNDSRHAGYISWSPADVFERSYKPITDTPAASPDTTYESLCASWHAAQPSPRRMPWRTAVEILSVVKKLPAEEREKLLALDDDKATATA